MLTLTINKLFNYLYFSNKEITKTSKINNLDSVTTEDIQKASDLKSIRIHLNDGSYQGFKKCINFILIMNINCFYLLDVSEIRTIQIKKICYVWCDNQGKFQKLVGLDRGLTTAQLHTFKGYSMREQFIR